jgi:ribosomal protein L21E
MDPRYKIGQKVMIMPSKQSLSPRDSAIEPYAGKSGTIVDFHWINVRTGAQKFYIYTVRVGEDGKEIVVHEDELKAYVE